MILCFALCLHNTAYTALVGLTYWLFGISDHSIDESTIIAILLDGQLLFLVTRPACTQCSIIISMTENKKQR